MPRRYWIAGGIAALALIWSAPLVTDQLLPLDPPLPERTLAAPECRLQEARYAADNATREYESAKRAANRTRPLEEYLGAVEAAQRGKQNAEDCEATAREWSDLWAQWQSARAATNMTRLAHAQLVATVFEIMALLATVGVGVWAILQARWDGNRDFGLMKQQADDARTDAAKQATRFQQQLDVARASANAAQQTADSYQKAARAFISVRDHSVEQFDGNVDGKAFSGGAFTTTWSNTGNSHAIECRAWADERVLPIGAPEPFFEKRGDPPPHVTIGAHSQFNAMPRYIAVADINAMILRKKRIFLWSRVEYRDVFSTEARYSETCVELEFMGSKPGPADDVRQVGFRFINRGPQNSAN